MPANKALSTYSSAIIYKSIIRNCLNRIAYSCSKGVAIYIIVLSNTASANASASGIFVTINNNLHYHYRIH